MTVAKKGPGCMNIQFWHSMWSLEDTVCYGLVDAHYYA
jgi:hypothetical protein